MSQGKTHVPLKDMKALLDKTVTRRYLMNFNGA